jgi:hypothetical protein
MKKMWVFGIVFMLMLTIVTAVNLPELPANIELPNSTTVIYRDTFNPANYIKASTAKEQYRCLLDCDIPYCIENQWFNTRQSTAIDVDLETKENLEYTFTNERKLFNQTKGAVECYNLKVKVPPGQKETKFNLSLTINGMRVILDPTIISGCTQVGALIECNGTLTGQRIDTDNASIWIHDAVIDGTSAANSGLLVLNTTLNQAYINLTGNITLDAYGDSDPSVDTNTGNITFLTNGRISINGATLNGYGNDCDPGEFPSSGYIFINGSSGMITNSNLDAHAGNCNGSPGGLSASITIGNNITMENVTLNNIGGGGGDTSSGSSLQYNFDGRFTAYDIPEMNNVNIQASGGYLAVQPAACSGNAGARTGGSGFITITNGPGVPFRSNGGLVLNASGRDAVRGNTASGGSGHITIIADNITLFNTLGSNSFDYTPGLYFPGCSGTNGTATLNLTYNTTALFQNTTIRTLVNQTTANTQNIYSTNTQIAKIGFFNSSALSLFFPPAYFYCNAPVLVYGNDSSVVAPDPQLNFSNCGAYSSNTTFVGIENFLNTSLLSVSLINPTNNAVTNNATINFTYLPIALGLNLSSCNLYTNETGSWAVRNTSNSPVNNAVNSFIRTFSSNNTYLWNVQCNATSGEQAFALTNRTFTIDTNAPAISFTPSYVANNLSFAYANTSESGATITVIEPNLVNVSYYVDGLLMQTIITSANPFIEVIGVNISNLSAGVHLLTAEACDLTATCQNSSYKFYKFNYSVNFTNPAVETTKNNYFLNVSRNSSFIYGGNATFIFDGVTYPATLNATANYLLFNSSLYLPDINVSTNYNFSWVYMLIGEQNQTYTTETYSQTVQPININTSCTPQNGSVSFYIFDENQPETSLNASMVESFTYLTLENSITQMNFSANYTDVHTFTWCFSPPEAHFYLQSHIQYKVDNNTHRYYLVNQSVQNDFQNHTLYNFQNSDFPPYLSTLSLVVRHDENYSYWPDLFVSLQRYYLSDGTWRTVQMGQTGQFGLVTFDILENIVDYRLLLRNSSGDTVYLSTQQSFNCAGLGICQFTLPIAQNINLISGPNPVAVYDYNNETEIVNITWIVPNGQTTTVSTFLALETFQGYTPICQATQTGAGGNIICNVSGYYGTAPLQVNTSDAYLISVPLDFERPSFGKALGREFASFLTLIIIMVLVGICIAVIKTPWTPVVGLVVGLILAYWLEILTLFTFGGITLIILLAMVIGRMVRN